MQDVLNSIRQVLGIDDTYRGYILTVICIFLSFIALNKNIQWDNGPDFLPDRGQPERDTRLIGLKKYRSEKHQDSKNLLNNSGEKMNECDPSLISWAIVTGASRGIGRAIAVELARQNSRIMSKLNQNSTRVRSNKGSQGLNTVEISSGLPRRLGLILVARDKTKLMELADDIEYYYGVPCTIVQLDFSDPDASATLYRTTVFYNLDVSILINNAGVATQSDVIDTALSDIDTMISINVSCVTKLCRLYGAEMATNAATRYDKTCGGMIMNISSVAGFFPAIPGAGVYAATKAYERHLSRALRVELSSRGVSVTCVMPGGTVQTNFASRSGMDDAFIWKVPMLTTTPEYVAGSAVRAMLNGDGEVIPGWTNRVTCRLFHPLLPSFVTTWLGEVTFRPFDWKLFLFGLLFSRDFVTGRDQEDGKGSKSSLTNVDKQQPPRFLVLKKRVE